MAIKSLSRKQRSRSMLIGNDAFVSNGFVSLATVTIGSGGQNTIEFANIPGTYQHLQIRGILRSDYNSVQPSLAMKINGGYIDRNHSVYGDGSASGTYTGTGSNISHSTGNAAGSSIFWGIIIDILDYASISKYKVVRALSGGDRNGAGFIELVSGLEKTTSAITSISIFEGDPAHKLMQYSTLALYGIRSG